MSPEIITGLIAIISGGSLTALLDVLFDYMKQRHTTREKDVDARIAAWQQISNKHENRIEILEKKIEICEADRKILERYISTLERTILKANPPLRLPPRPTLQSENIIQ